MTSTDSNIRPDFSSVMALHVWTKIGVNREELTSEFISTTYRPGRPWRIVVIGSAVIPEFSRAMQ